ncbi:hypothetical protein ACQJBY_067454 [Aegilops geniculata]
MGRLLASLLCFLLVASVEHAAGAPTPEQYWKSVLPDTPMPSSLSKLLSTSSASVGEHQKPPGTAVGIWAFHYFDHYDATETHLQHMADDPSAALFFLEKDLQMHYTGRKKLTKVLHFMATSGAGERFLPRSEADAIPFSSGEVPEILSRFSVKPESVEAAEMARTLHVCEAPAAEVRHFAGVHGRLRHVQPRDQPREGRVHRRRQGWNTEAGVHPDRRETRRRRPARGLPCGAVRVRSVRVPPDAGDESVHNVHGRRGRHGGGGRRGVPRRHGRLEPEARRVPGAQGAARHRAGVPLGAAGPRRLDPQPYVRYLFGCLSRFHSSLALCRQTLILVESEK